ncbi:acyl carrier protein [Streptomyces sp. ACA25]|uniref:acyl carrier protein n=1 Tax=Streptomyces sp. ACA25 TaxID=3022596 RepID=UPI0023070C11|nr:acyl carrier protein [Streptomyces sp. ACA25]MDB1089744.1 acyl carrier protein [Streptomyces sp. ACA25]
MHEVGVLKDILVSDLQLREEDIVPSATREEVGLDSLAVLELVTVLNERLGIEVHDYEVLDTTTLADVARLVVERQAAG